METEDRFGFITSFVFLRERYYLPLVGLIWWTLCIKKKYVNSFYTSESVDSQNSPAQWGRFFFFLFSRDICNNGSLRSLAHEVSS